MDKPKYVLLNRVLICYGAAKHILRILPKKLLCKIHIHEKCKIVLQSLHISDILV